MCRTERPIEGTTRIMFRRLRLPGKLALAALPLVALLAAGATWFAIDSLEDADQQEFASSLAQVWLPLQAVIDELASEEVATLEALDELSSQDITAMRGEFDLTSVRAVTDAAVSDLDSYLVGLNSPEPMVRQLDVARSAVTAVRAFFDESGTSPTTQRVRIPEGYDLVDAQILQIGDLVVGEVQDVSLGRDLSAVAALNRALQAAAIQDRTVALLEPGERLGTDLETVRRSGVDVSQWISAFESSASDEWVADFRDSDVPQGVFDSQRFSGQIVRSPLNPFRYRDANWEAASTLRRESLSTFQGSRIDAVVDSALTSASDVRQSGLIVLLAAVAAAIGALLITVLIARSIVRRVRTITETARDVSQTQLPALVEALRDPSEDVALPSIAPIRDRGADEVGDLARSFSAMQSTLEHVASQQVEVLRRGVADMFITLARRNRSLIDRQLSMIDDLEQKEENPDTLAEFYQLDHLATRMRRNAESLLVLAGSEPQKKWRSPLEIDDVVRAALGEVEDYRRIDVLALEGLRLNGNAVADIAHLVSELLENATSFSPPETRVRIAGHFHDGGYLLTLSDRGVGIPATRLKELNHLLMRPPVVGLALEPTLGLYVVAMLSKRHGIKVRLVAGAPGVTAHVLLPDALFEQEPVDAGPAGRQAASPAPSNGHTAPMVTIPVSEPAPRPVREVTVAIEPVQTPAELKPEREPEIRSARPITQIPPAAHATTEPTSNGGLPIRAGTSGPPSNGASEMPVIGGEPVAGNGLPTRRPGASFNAPDVDERPVDNSQRDPDQIKSAFSSFQLGVAVGRGSSDEGEES